MYRIGQVAAQLDVSPSTVRRWSDRFASWLSSEAGTPDLLESGRHAARSYSEADLVVLTTVQRLQQEGLEEAELESRLHECFHSNGSNRDSGALARLRQEEEGYLPPVPAAALTQAFHQLAETQQAHHDLLNAVLNHALHLKDENERLRKRLRVTEEEMAQLKESDWNHRLALEERMAQIEREQREKRSLWDRLFRR